MKLFEKGQRRDLACQVISENAGAVEDKTVRAALYQKLGELYEKAGELGEGGEAYVLAAESEGGPKMWAEFMDELRETHLGMKRKKSGARVGERLQAAYEKVVSRR